MGNEFDLTTFLAFVASRPFGFVLRSAAHFGAARRRFRAARARRGEGARAPAQKRRGLRIAQMGSNWWRSFTGACGEIRAAAAPRGGGDERRRRER